MSVTLSGNQFMLNGQPFVPHGFNSIALLDSPWCSTPQTVAAAANFGAAELQTAVSSWNANTVRFQVSQPVLAGPNGAAYAAKIQSGVSAAQDAGLVVIVSMQDQGPACGPSEPLPSQETANAWAALIGNTTLGSDPGVMFELFNEPRNAPVAAATTNPQQQTWPDWQNGGREIQPTQGQKWAAYTPVGHQQLVDYLRTSLGLTNVLIADGATAAENLAGLPALSDPGSSYQIAYAVHPYSYAGGQSEWDANWGYLASSYAVAATEWNYAASDCGHTKQALAPQFLGYMRNTAGIGILGQALDIFKGLLAADTSLDPTQCGTASPGSGFDFLNSYVNTFPPAGSASPAAPAGLASTDQTTTSISLTWDASYDPAFGSADLSYTVYRDGQVAGTTPAGTTSFTDNSLSPGTAYSYTVTGTDPAGNTSRPSAALSQATLGCLTLPAPTGLTATAQSGTVVALGWHPVTPAAGCGIASYLVKRGGVTIGVSAGTSYTDAAAAASTTYTYQVLAVGTGGSQGSPAAVTVTTPKVADTTRPSPATGLKASAESPTYVLLSWSPGSDPESGVKEYQILRNGVRVATVPSTSLSFSSTGLHANTAYTYKVVTVDGAGLTAASAAVRVTTP